MFAESFVALTALLSVQATQYNEPAMARMVLHTFPVAKYVAKNSMPPIKRRAESVGAEISARAATVMDAESGEILFEKDADAVYPIASLTKLITAMVVLDLDADLKQEVTILAEDDAHDGKDILQQGERIARGDLLRSLLVGSVNTSGNALARSLGGKEIFVAQMNQKANELNLRQAVFVDPTGLGSENQASARDVVIMLRAALSYPNIRDAMERTHAAFVGRATGRTYDVKSTNLLLDSFLNRSPYQIIGAKTGSLPEAGFCLAQSTRNKDGGEVISVVLGSENHFTRFQDVKALTYWAFQTYEWPKSGT